MAPAHSRLQSPEGHILRIGVDLGTGKIQIDCQHLQGADTRDTAEIRPICLKDDQTARIEQIAILPETGPVIYGIVDVEEAVARNPTLQNKVLELWKLSLHPEFQDLDEVKHVLETLYAKTDEQLDRGAVQDFVEEQLRCVIWDIREYFKTSNRNAGKDASYWDNIPLELQISVPAMWGDDQRGLVRNAACNALGVGIPNNKVELREEPLCVATVYILDLVLSGSIKEGQCLLLIDCGKGTLDIATVTLVRAPSKDVLMQLQRVGPCSGNGAGSHTINTQAWKWISSGKCQEVPDLDACCVQLGISKREILRQFSKEIDRVKNETRSTQSDSFVTIRSSHGGVGPGRITRLTIELPHTVIVSWYEYWISSAKQLVKEHLDMQDGAQYRCASLTGGGCLSKVFKDAMKTVLSQAPYNIEIGTATACISPCSQGALQQHYFQEDELPASANFYLALTEEYQAALHKDEAVQRSQYKSSKKVLHERLRRIMRYENGTFTGADRTPILFLVEADEYGIRIHVDLYYSEDDVEEHSALRLPGGGLRPDVRSYPLISVDLEDLSEHGFIEKKGGKGGKKHYELRTFVQMTGTSDKLEITIDAMEHYYRFPEERYGQAHSKESVLWTFTREMWNKSMSHFVRNVTGTARTAGTSDASANPGPSVNPSPQISAGKRKADIYNGLQLKNTPKRATRNRHIDYAADQYVE